MMDPPEAFTKNQAKFNEDLTDLINTAAVMASSTTNSPSTVPTTPSPQTDPHLRKRAPPSPHQKAAKRLKLEDKKETALPHLNIHPSRLELVASRSTTVTSTDAGSPCPTGHVRLCDEVPLLQRTGSNCVPLGNILKRRATEASGTDLVARREPYAPGRKAPGVISNELNSTTSTLRDAVWRQWDSSKNELPYEELLEKRRMEQLGTKVDRYVPSSAPLRAHKSSANIKSSSAFPYTRLPESVRAKILALLLVNTEPIIIDFTWLRSFVNGHCRVPVIDKTIKDGFMSAYTVPMEWDQLVKDVDIMQKDCLPFKPALEDRGNKTRKRKAPCRGLTTGVLTVSKEMHAQAASIFYGSNAFRFPWPSSGWMQLESFLATIGPTNVNKLCHITIHAPLWHRGIKEDYLEGSILDLTSPASRLGVVKSSSRDRLLSAIAGSVEALLKAGKLDTFAIDLEHGLTTERWAGSYSNTRRLIPISEADEHGSRKQEGIKLLKRLSETLPSPPVLTVLHQTPAIGKYDLSEFRSRLASVIREAAKYGWKVDQQLNGRR